MPNEKKLTDPNICMWVIPNFPRKLKDRYTAFCRGNGKFVKEHLAYLIAKTLLDAKVKIPAFHPDNSLINEAIKLREACRKEDKHDANES